MFPIGVWVRAELRNVKLHSSGHVYLSLADEEASVDAVMWRNVSQALGFKPEDGMKVEAFGSPTLYDKTGRYQFSVRRLIPIGEGARAVAFRQLKLRLAEEGLFSPERKRRLPRFPFTIGVVTSPTGAAIRDIINVVRRRAPFVTVIVRPSAVQGDSAAREIIAGIADLNRLDEVELIIIGRGGGSEEDLWCFNDEALARAIFSSKKPIISAVGHEIDFTISDFVADLRAPTPSAAAEIAVPDVRELRASIENMLNSSRVRCNMLFDGMRSRLDSDMRRAAWFAPLRRIHDLEQRLDVIMEKAGFLERGLIERLSGRLYRHAERLSGLSVKNTLKRGFAIVYRNGSAIESAIELATNDAIEIELKDGRRQAIVE